MSAILALVRITLHKNLFVLSILVLLLNVWNLELIVDDKI